MTSTSKNYSHVNDNTSDTEKSHLGETFSDLLNEGKKVVNEFYHDGLNRVNAAEDTVKEYSEALLQKIQKNPLSALLIAGGIGFLLSELLRK